MRSQVLLFWQAVWGSIKEDVRGFATHLMGRQWEASPHPHFPRKPHLDNRYNDARGMRITRLASLL